MKKIIMSFMLVLASLPVLADNASDARKALDKASSIITSGTGAQASFTISGNNIGKQKGKISIRGNRFCAQTPSATVWYDGKTQWTYLKANNEDEILVTQKLIDSALSSLPDYQNCKLFAPPSGSIGNKMFEACKKLDYKVIMWTRDT